MSYAALLATTKNLANSAKVKVNAGFFKTGKGNYGYGDKFLGLIVPKQREIARKFIGLPLADLQKLLNNEIHEHRFIALEILVMKYERAILPEQKKLAGFYLKNTKRINNWDLVDTSAPYILGDWLVSRSKAILYKLAKSKNIWDRRIAIVATFAFIRKGQFTDTLKISEILLHDEHDLIHKAVGWMLREAGKQNAKVLVGFLNRHYRQMPRTMLRYAIERFDEKTRKNYLRK